MTLKSNLIKALNWCLDLIFPKYCLSCNLEGSYLCPDCLKSLSPLKSVSCFVCGRRSPSDYACDSCRHKERSLLAGILVAADWNNLLLRQIIYEYKYRFIKELANPLSELMINFLENSKPESWQTEPTNKEADQPILIPIPLHGRRLAWRGFNQAELLAQKISARFNIPLAKNILIRSRHTLPQREITDQNTRTANIENAFALTPKFNADQNNFLKNKVVVLIDDICTTGATFQDCARALKPLGSKEIWGLVIARG